MLNVTRSVTQKLPTEVPSRCGSAPLVPLVPPAARAIETSGALDPTRLESLGSQRGAPMEHFESELFGTRVPGSVALPTK